MRLQYKPQKRRNLRTRFMKRGPGVGFVPQPGLSPGPFLVVYSGPCFVILTELSRLCDALVEAL